MSKTIFINNVRLCHPDLFQAREYEKGDGKPRYSATLLVEPDSDADKTIRAAISEAIKEKFPEAKKAEHFLKSVQGQSMKFCYRDGDTKTGEAFQGNWFIAAHRKVNDGPPAVVDQKRQPVAEGSGKVYAGCYVNAKVDIYVQTDNPGVRCGLLALQFVRDGDAFAGGVASATGFEELDSGDSDDTGSEFY